MIIDASFHRVVVLQDLQIPTTMAYVPQKPLSNATNVCPDIRACLPTPPQDVGCKRKISQLDETPTKRLRITGQAANDSDDDGDIEMEPVEILNSRTRRHTMFNLLKSASFRPPTVTAPTIRTPSPLSLRHCS